MEANSASFQNLTWFWFWFENEKQLPNMFQFSFLENEISYQTDALITRTPYCFTVW